MITSRQPWTLDGLYIKDASGNMIAFFNDHRDADLVVNDWQGLETREEMAQEIKYLKEELDLAEKEIKDLEEKLANDVLGDN